MRPWAAPRAARNGCGAVRRCPGEPPWPCARAGHPLDEGVLEQHLVQGRAGHGRGVEQHRRPVHLDRHGPGDLVGLVVRLRLVHAAHRGGQQHAGQRRQRLLRHGIQRRAGGDEQGVTRVQPGLPQGGADAGPEHRSERHSTRTRGDVGAAQAEGGGEAGRELAHWHGTRFAHLDVDDPGRSRLREQAADPRATRAEGAGHLRLGGVLEVVEPRGAVEQLGGKRPAGGSSPLSDRLRATAPHLPADVPPRAFARGRVIMPGNFAEQKCWTNVHRVLYCRPGQAHDRAKRRPDQRRSQ